MKILLAADIFPPQSGGPATYVVTLANELSKLGDEVRIVSLNTASDRSAVGCRLSAVSSRNKLLRYAEYFWLLFREVRYADVVYAMGPVNAGLPALVATRLRRKKFVVKVVGDYAWEQYQQSAISNRLSAMMAIDEFQKIKSKGKIGWLKKIEFFVARHAEQVIVPSKYLKRMVVHWGADEKKVAVVYNAVAAKPVVPTAKMPGQQWIVSAGRLVPWKGFELLVGIMKDLPAAVQLKIIGDGPEYDNIRNQISKINMFDRIELLGNISHIETQSYLAAADVFVLNSAYEGLSHVILEALSLGAPVLASSIGGNSEILPAKNLFTYNDAPMILAKIMASLSEPKVAVELSERFQLPYMIRQTRQLFDLVCS